MKTLFVVAVVGLLAQAYALPAPQDIAEYQDIDDDDVRSLGEVTKKCGCEVNDCGCCIRADTGIPGAALKFCSNISVVPSEYGFNFRARVGKNVFFNKTLSAQKLSNICKTLPKFSSWKFCFRSSMEQLGSDANSFKWCASVDLSRNNKPIAVLNIKCINYMNGQIGFEGFQESPTDALVSFNVPNPAAWAVNRKNKKQ